MQTPYMNAAILLAYAYVDDRSVVPVLQEIVKHDTSSLNFFQECAFKLQTLRYLAYISHGNQRIITAAGRKAAAQVRATMLEQHGPVSDMALIRTLSDGCVKELADWVSVNNQAQWMKIERVAAQMEKQ